MALQERTFDDMRESPSLTIIEESQKGGARGQLQRYLSRPWGRWGSQYDLQRHEISWIRSKGLDCVLSLQTTRLRLPEDRGQRRKGWGDSRYATGRSSQTRSALLVRANVASECALVLCSRCYRRSLRTHPQPAADWRTGTFVPLDGSPQSSSKSTSGL